MDKRTRRASGYSCLSVSLSAEKRKESQFLLYHVCTGGAGCLGMEIGGRDGTAENFSAHTTKNLKEQ